MLWLMVGHILSSLLDFVTCSQQSSKTKDLEILVLRYQLHILQRTLVHSPRPSRWEKLVLAILTARLRHLAKSVHSHWHQSILLFQPDTILRWHRELVRRKWTFIQRRVPGRPCISPEVEDLIVRLARENPRWGYSRVHGELGKLGYSIGRSTVRDVLKRHQVPPAPQRGQFGSTWRNFLRHYRHQMLACDFFTVETLFLRTVYVLFFIELGRHRVHLGGCTMHPTSVWVAQQARHLSWEIQDGVLPMRFLIHDRDTKFCPAFDRVFTSEGIEIIRTPYRSPNANAFAERWVRSVREECLDYLLIMDERHLRRVLLEYRDYFNYRRPHQGLAQQCPVPSLEGPGDGRVYRRDLLGGVLHDYCRKAA